jgi:hypothetical protein
MRRRTLRLAVAILLIIVAAFGLALLAAGTSPRGATPHTSTPSVGGGPWAG